MVDAVESEHDASFGKELIRGSNRNKLGRLGPNLTAQNLTEIIQN